MTMNRVLTILFFAVILMTSCKSKYETIRTSQDPELIYNTGLKYYDEGDITVMTRKKQDSCLPILITDCRLTIS